MPNSNYKIANILQTDGMEIGVASTGGVLSAADTGIAHDRLAAACLHGIAGAPVSVAGTGIAVERMTATKLVSHFVGNIIDVE